MPVSQDRALFSFPAARAALSVWGWLFPSAPPSTQIYPPRPWLPNQPRGVQAAFKEGLGHCFQSSLQTLQLGGRGAGPHICSTSARPSQVHGCSKSQRDQGSANRKGFVAALQSPSTALTEHPSLPQGSRELFLVEFPEESFIQVT